MSTEIQSTPEQEAKKEAWLKNFANFIVIANRKKWIAGVSEVEPHRPGYNRLRWPYSISKMSEQDLKDYRDWRDWLLEDEFTGFYRASGMTIVYYKKRPAWVMFYGGHGQTEGYEDRAKQTYEFLKTALKQVSPEMPFRGPKEYIEGNKRYVFTLLQGDITDCLWREEIYEDDELTFTQTGVAGILIHRDSNKKPMHPWDL